MTEVTLGIDVACRARHQASLANGAGELLWSGYRFSTVTAELERLWAKIPAGSSVTVVMEPTRNAWAPLAGWLGARGARVVMVPPEQSSDLRKYYNKHTKTDRLDSQLLARLPLLHPDGMRTVDGLGPADALKRAVRRRSSLQTRRGQAMLRLDALLELLGPGWGDVLGTGDYTKTALAVLNKWADPRALKKAGVSRVAALMTKASRGQWGDDKAGQLVAAAEEALALWQDGGLDFAELAADIASEVRSIIAIGTEVETVSRRIERLYRQADPEGIVLSAPGLGVTLSAGILGRTGNFDRFANLAGVRAFPGLVPSIDQSGTSDRHGPPTKSGDPGLRHVLYLAADKARKVDPTLAARYKRPIETGKHHNSALCSIAPILLTRIAAAWRKGEHYQLRDVDGTPITEQQGRQICADRYQIDPHLRKAHRNPTTRHGKKRTSRRKKESTKAAPADGPSTPDHTDTKVA